MVDSFTWRRWMVSKMGVVGVGEQAPGIKKLWHRPQDFVQGHGIFYAKKRYETHRKQNIQTGLSQYLDNILWFMICFPARKVNFGRDKIMQRKA